MSCTSRCGDRTLLISLQCLYGLVLGPRVGPGGKPRPERCTPSDCGWPGRQRAPRLEMCPCHSLHCVYQGATFTHEGLGNTVRRRERSPDSERVEAKRQLPQRPHTPVLSRGREGGKTASVAKDTLSPSPSLYGAGDSGLRTFSHWTRSSRKGEELQGCCCQEIEG